MNSVNGNWHFVACAAFTSMLAILTSFSTLLFGVFLIWISYLFYIKRIATLPLVLSFLFLLFFYFYLPHLSSNNQLDPLKHPITVSGPIVSPVEKTTSRLSFVIQDEQINEKIAVAYFPDQEGKYDESIRYGSTCSFTTEISAPDTATNPGQFDYRRYLLTKEIKYEAVLSDLQLLKCVKNRGILQSLDQIRHSVLDYTDKRLSKETSSWVRALVFGDDSSVNKETVELFQRWGMSHLLAISGLHVGIITGLLYFVLIKLNLLTKEWTEWAILIFLPIYAVLAGGEPSVWRASLMACILIILHKTGWKWNVTDVLSLVFLFLLATDKFIMYQVGFQLSFAVTFALLLSKRILFQTKNRLFQVLYISFIAQIAILPIQFYYFSLFQPASIVVNLIMVPYYSAFFIPAMFLLLLFTPLPWASLLDNWFMNIHHVAMQVVHWFDEHMHFPLVSGPLPWFVVLLYYVLFILFMQWWEKEKLRHAFYCGCLIVLLLIGNGLRPYFSPVGTVTMLDIGQGDAFVIELPYRKGVILIDAGATFSFTDYAPSRRMYEQVIKPYLFSRGIQQLDAVILTHEDMDHIGSVPYLLQEFAVNTIIVSPFFDTAKLEFNRVPEDVNLITAKGNSEMNVGGHLLQILAPIQDNHDSNQNSMVLYTNLGGKNWLFTGDITKEEEKDVIRKYPNLSIDVLKVAHHGSDTSTDEALLQELSPKIALIPVGRDNRYGHPADDVVQRLEDKEMTILRTDQHGAVQYHFQDKAGIFTIIK